MTIRPRTASILVVLGALVGGAIANRAALYAPLEMDDVAQRAMIEGKLTPRRGPFNLYDFVADDNRAALLDRGTIPWWSNPNIITRFLRPVPSVLIWVDHRLFGWGATGPHVLSFLWWVAAVMAAHLLYRTTLGRAAALGATAIFAFSPALAIPLVWAANRNILVTVTFGAIALVLYVRWRDGRRPVQGAATAGAFIATALTGEYALCIVGYLIAFEMCRRAEPPLRRLIGALPSVGPLVVYVGVRAALGYGAKASGFYRDPITAAGAFAENFQRVLSVLVGASWLGVDVSSPWFSSEAFATVLILGAGVLVAASVWCAQRGHSGGDYAAGTWLACGSVLALLPLTVTEPSQRLLGVTALGVSGSVAVLLVDGVRRRGLSLPRVVLMGGAAVAGAIHLATAPFHTRGLSLETVEDMIEHLARFDTVPRDARSIDTTVVLRASGGLPVLSAPYLLRGEAPQRWRVLSHTFEQTTAVRVSARRIDVTLDSVPLFPIGRNGIVRTVPFKAGDVTEIAGLRATVLRVDQSGSPMAVRYDFDRDLDDPGVAWIAEGRSGFVSIIPPPVGFGVRLAP